METGKRIKAYRQAAHKTQMELADAIGVNRVTITKYESGVIAPPIEKLEKIAAVLGCSIVDLIDKDAFDNASGEDRAAVLDSVWKDASAQFNKADSIAKIAGYEWVILPDLEEIEEKTIYLTDKKTGTLYAVESDLFTAAVDGSADYIQYNFEKLMKSARIINNGK